MSTNIINFKVKSDFNRYNQNDSSSLFYYAVYTIVYKLRDRKGPLDLSGSNRFKNHNQWANLIFGKGSGDSVRFMSQIKRDFSNYFIMDYRKYAFNWEEILKDFNHIFENESGVVRKVDEIDEMISSLDDEIKASIKFSRNNTINIRLINKKLKINNDVIYEIILDLDTDDFFKIESGLIIKLHSDYKKFDCEVIDYDSIESKIYVKCSYDISRISGKKKVEIDNSWLIIKVKDYVLQNKNNIQNSDVYKNTVIKLWLRYMIDKNNIKLCDNKDLDQEQIRAFSSAIDKRVTIIWGPPGTGKSHTISNIINHFIDKNEKTLVLCLANVALDSLLLKVIGVKINNQDELKKYQVVRVGLTKNDKIFNINNIFPENQNTIKIKNEIDKINQRLPNVFGDTKIELKSKLNDLKKELESEINTIVSRSNAVFATTSRFFVDNLINRTEFDNVIIDEASMVSVPHFLSIIQNIKKRIIISGDFKQLGPVVLSQTENSRKWLQKDIFGLFGIDLKNPGYNTVFQLNVQRRFPEQICDLINEPFYANKLNTGYKNITLHLPTEFNNKITYVNSRGISVSNYSSKQSRYNDLNTDFVLNALEIFVNKKISISSYAIITPYREQVKLYEKKLQNEYSEIKKLINLKVGTIHSFQGEESDVVFFDMVDTIKLKEGKLFKGDSGAKLLNVAISRARHVLVVLGELDLYLDSINVNIEAKKCIKKLYKYDKTKELKHLFS